MRILKYLVISLILLCVIIWFGVKDALHPIQSAPGSQPVYTVGDLHYLQALNNDKNVVKFGRMFWGLYPGGLAFSSPEEALLFVQNNQAFLDQFSSGWAVYELSGDYDQDTYISGERRYLKHSMLVLRSIQR